MRVQDYKDLEVIVKELKGIVTALSHKNISGDMARKYASIAKSQTDVDGDIEGIYSVGELHGVYFTLVVFDGVSTKSIRKSLHGIINTSNNSYYDVSVTLAGSDIFDSLPDLYDVVCSMLLPAPEDDIYCMYCFFNAFRGIYTHEDICAVVKSLMAEDYIVSVVEYLLDNYYEPGYIPDMATIELTKLNIRAELENTTKKTE